MGKEIIDNDLLAARDGKIINVLTLDGYHHCTYEPPPGIDITYERYCEDYIKPSFFAMKEMWDI